MADYVVSVLVSTHDAEKQKRRWVHVSDITLELQNDSPFDITAKEVQTEVTCGLMRLEGFTPEDKAKAETLAAEIDLRGDLSDILSYGHKQQKQLSRFADKLLKHALDCDVGEVSELLQELKQVIQEFDASLDTGAAKIFRSAKKRKVLQDKYYVVLKSLRQIQKQLDGWKMRLLVKIDALDAMYRAVLGYYGDLALRIIAGEQKLQEVKASEASVSTELAEADFLRGDLRERCDTFERRLQDLKASKSAFLQVAVQIQLARKVDYAAIQMISSSLDNAIPLWTSGVAAALTVRHAKEAIRTRDSELLGIVDESLELQTRWQRRRFEAESNQ